MRVVAEGAALAVRVACGFALIRLAGSFLVDLKMPGVMREAGSALILLLAAVIAPVIPAARAARIDVTQALRMD